MKLQADALKSLSMQLLQVDIRTSAILINLQLF